MSEAQNGNQGLGSQAAGAAYSNAYAPAIERRQIRITALEAALRCAHPGSTPEAVLAVAKVFGDYLTDDEPTGR